MPDLPELHAVIGVRHEGERTFYVRRSEKMENYPSVWSLPSIQFARKAFGGPTDLEAVQELFDRMSEERFGGVGVRVNAYLTSGDSSANPFGNHVHLHLYAIELEAEPVLKPDYYTDSAWLLPEEYEERSADEQCGLCLRLWADYAWMHGITSRPFQLPPLGETAS